jgi:hypothetical protein
MQSVQLKLVENETSPTQKSEHAGPVVSALVKEGPGKKEQSDQQPATPEALFAAFTWLFGSGCY